MFLGFVDLLLKLGVIKILILVSLVIVFVSVSWCATCRIKLIWFESFIQIFNSFFAQIDLKVKLLTYLRFLSNISSTSSTFRSDWYLRFQFHDFMLLFFFLFLFLNLLFQLFVYFNAEWVFSPSWPWSIISSFLRFNWRRLWKFINKIFHFLVESSILNICKDFLLCTKDVSNLRREDGINGSCRLFNIDMRGKELAHGLLCTFQRLKEMTVKSHLCVLV